jgi:voltage-gated potassium channel
MQKHKSNRRQNSLKVKLHEIIFEADTPAGKAFDVALLIAIVASVLAVVLETVGRYQFTHGNIFHALEWIFTILFTIEYLLRLYSVRHPLKYATSFYGVVDLLAILPTYLSVIFASAQSLLVIRILRLLRVFRIFKLAHFLKESRQLVRALKASRAKISVFLFFILLMVTIIGAVMYLVEGSQGNSNFSSIPRSMYWAVVTLTTVGYGDITPTTELGQFLSAIVMVMGYAVIAVPTGIVSVELFRTPKEGISTQACRYCGKEGHDADADFCKYCGNSLHT